MFVREDQEIGLVERVELEQDKKIRVNHADEVELLHDIHPCRIYGEGVRLVGIEA